LPNARVNMQQVSLWQVFIWQVLFTGVNVSEKGVYRRHDRKITIVHWLSAQITLTSFLCWPIQTNNFFYDKCTCSKASMLADQPIRFPVHQMDGNPPV
jgi:predicted AlkP superfamily phosphohydrolase/phosphomutase